MFNQLSSVGQFSTFIASFCLVLFGFYFFTKVLGFGITTKSSSSSKSPPKESELLNKLFDAIEHNKDTLIQIDNRLTVMDAHQMEMLIIVRDMKEPFFKLCTTHEKLCEQHNAQDGDGVFRWWVKESLYEMVKEIESDIDNLTMQMKNLKVN